MDITARFLPVADGLINRTFPTPIIYHRKGTATYDPATGDISAAEVDHNINAGILNRQRIEQNGVEDAYEIMLWVDHKTLPLLPTTADSISYDGKRWKIIAVDPTYSSVGLIASKLKARAN